MKLNKLLALNFGFSLLFIAGCSGGSSSSNTAPTPINGALITYTYSVGNEESVIRGESFTVTATLTATTNIPEQTISAHSLTPASESITFSSPTTPCIISSSSPTCTMTVTIGDSAESGIYTLTMQSGPLFITESNDVTTFDVTTIRLNPMILITAVGHNGDFGGNIATIDAFCNANITRPAGDTRTYKAMLSGAGRVACTTTNCAGGTTGQTDWVLKPDTTYYRGDNTTIIFTTNESAIFSTWPAESSIVAEGSNPTDRVWTGMGNNTWMENETCNNWSSADDSGTIRGRAAYPTSNEISMMYSGPLQTCDTSYILYCVSQ